MKKIILAAVVAAVLTFAAVAHTYTGHAGCPSWVPPWTTVTCAYHTNIRRAVAYASQSHWVGGAGTQWGRCDGSCVADTGWGRPGDGHTRVGNETGTWMYIWWAYDY